MQGTLAFVGEVVDQQTFLDGTREFTIEAQSDDADGWLMTLSFRWAAEIDAAVEEGDLSLTGADGAGVYAAVTDGTAASEYDEDSAEDVTTLRLLGEVRSGEGQFADWTGTISVTGRLTGDQAFLEATTDLTPPA